MLLESAEINQDITETVKKVNEKIKQVSNNVVIRELEKVVKKWMNKNENKKNIMRKLTKR